MRTAAIVFVAVLTALVVGVRANAAERDGSGLAAPSPRTPHDMIIAEGGSATPDPLVGDSLAGTMPATSSIDEIPSAPPQPAPADSSASSDSQETDPSQNAQTAPDGEQSPDAAQEQSLDPEFPDENIDGDVPPHVYSLQDFIDQGMEDSPIGMELREDCSRLKDHEKVCGLAVLDVRRGSPAAKAGIHQYTALTHDLLDGASVAAALVFPPAIIAVAAIDQSGIGESFDLIIGVDGRRVRHILDFQDMTSNLRPGDIVYLTVVRAGKRLQIPVHLPANAAIYQYPN